MRNLVIATCGHVDHGKTSLVKALTGVNTDNLKEEKQRGITVNLGFTYLKLDDNHTVGIVDVPGHEKLIKNMLAGVCGINLILLTVSCDDGIMPQTREHFEIIKFLNIKNIIVVLTKIDLVTKERIEEVKKAIKEEFNLNLFVEFSIYQEETKENVLQLIKDNLSLENENINEIFRMPIDRVFSVKGQGTVVTGSSLSGMVKIGDELEILPTKQRVKVRGIQSFNQAREIAYKHMRVALNLGGVKKEDISRGKIIATKDVFSLPSKILDVKITTSKRLEKPIKNLEKVKFYYLASEIKCRIKLIYQKELKAGDTTYCQLLLDDEIYASNKDLGILRSINPVDTIAGVQIINVFGEYVKRNDRSFYELLNLYEKEDIRELLKYYITSHPFINLSELKQRLNLIDKKDEDIIKIIKDFAYIFYDNSCLMFEKLKELNDQLITLLTKYHRDNPYEIGLNKQICKQELKLDKVTNKTFNQILFLMKAIEIKNDIVKLHSFSIKYNQEEQRIVNMIKNFIDSFNFKPPKLEDILDKIKGKNVRNIYYSLIKEKELISIDKDIVLTKNKFKEMINIFNNFFKNNNLLTLNDARNLLDTSRKYLVAYLEYLDKIGYTRRIEEGRIKKNEVNYH